MSWEHRGRQLIYYRARKVGGRVVRTYCGGGERARQAADEDAARRAEREASARAWRAQQTRLEAADAVVAELIDGVEALARAHLLLGGYHQHARGHWRRRRGA